MSPDFYEDEAVLPQEREIGLGTAFKRLVPFLARHKWGLLTCLGLLVSITGLSLVWPVLIQRAIDNKLVEQLGLPVDQRNFTPLLYIAGAIVVIQLKTATRTMWCLS